MSSGAPAPGARRGAHKQQQPHTSEVRGCQRIHFGRCMPLGRLPGRVYHYSWVNFHCTVPSPRHGAPFQGIAP